MGTTRSQPRPRLLQLLVVVQPPSSPVQRPPASPVADRLSTLQVPSLPSPTASSNFIIHLKEEEPFLGPFSLQQELHYERGPESFSGTGRASYSQP